MRDQKLHAVVARSTFTKSKCQNASCSEHFLGVEISGDVEKVHTAVTRSQNNKKPQVWSTFGSEDVGKVRTDVARSTFGSQNVKNTSVSEHDWKLRCGKHTIIVRNTFGS